MKLGLAEILEITTRQESYQAKVDYLRKNGSVPLRKILEFAFDKRIEWDIPVGVPPYKPCPFLDQEGMLFREMKKMYLFLKGGNPNLTPMKREMLFIDLLQSIPKSDADLLIAVKDHIMPYDISEQLVRDAFPDCLQFPPTVVEEPAVAPSEAVEVVIEKPKVKAKKKPTKKVTKEQEVN